MTVNPVFIDKLAEYGISKEKITYIPNVVSEKNFYPLKEEAKKKDKKEIWNQAGSLYCSLRRPAPEKKRNLRLSGRSGENAGWEFVWAGGFSFGKISEGYEEIKTKMEDLPKNVKFLGLVEREEMNQIYNMADVMFLPSYEELFPMTILEAMNCRLPVLVRNLDIYRPILFDYVLQGKNQEEFINVLERLHKDAEFLSRKC